MQQTGKFNTSLLRIKELIETLVSAFKVCIR